ncbi:MAG: diguanylate cyclase [Nitrospirae bacterium]|nr:diguanylate cyclase [Nitrospirota bacterium]
MSHEINLRDTDLATFEEKVYVLADELLAILKDLSKENQKQVSSKLIAEKMFLKESVKIALVHSSSTSASKEMESLKEIANLILDRFVELMPSHMTENLSSMKDKFKDHEALKNSTEWLDSPITILKKYINSITTRNKELDEFLKQTMMYLAAIEGHLTNELSSHQQKFKDDRSFEENISSNVSGIQQSFNASGDFSNIKAAVLNKIENINKGIEKKRSQDMTRLKEAEKTLGEMWERMNAIKQEADEIRKRSQEIEFESVRDKLTGLYNRKAYDEKISQTLADVERYNVPASLMVCDIDFFKKINDKFGHKVGDLALKKLADLLRERLRKNDFITRYGGEEFVVILSHTDIKNAATAGEGVRSYIDKSVFSYKNHHIPLTISIGVSSFRKGDDVTTVFERADNALYLAKRSGRNRVKTENDVIAEGAVLDQATPAEP